MSSLVLAQVVALAAVFFFSSRLSVGFLLTLLMFCFCVSVSPAVRVSLSL